MNSTAYTSRPMPTEYQAHSRALSPLTRARSDSPCLASREACNEKITAGTPVGGKNNEISAKRRYVSTRPNRFAGRPGASVSVNSARLDEGHLRRVTLEVLLGQRRERPVVDQALDDRVEDRLAIRALGVDRPVLVPRLELRHDLELPVRLRRLTEVDRRVDDHRVHLPGAQRLVRRGEIGERLQGRHLVLAVTRRAHHVL